MDAAIFRAAPMGLRERMLAIPFAQRLTYDAVQDVLFINFERLNVRTPEDVDAIGVAMVQHLVEHHRLVRPRIPRWRATMKWRNLEPRSMVILYFGCLSLLWGGIAATGIAAEGVAGSLPSTNDVRTGLYHHAGIVALALHAAAVVLLAWKAHRRLFAHGPFAVVFCGLPILPLLANVWFVPAFLYLIAVLHVWMACRHESPGRLQATRPHPAERRQA
jgi:hypothetical protein